LDPEQVPAHEARCRALGNLLMSAPVSAMITSARLMEIPGMVTIRSRGGQSSGIIGKVP